MRCWTYKPTRICFCAKVIANNARMRSATAKFRQATTTRCWMKFWMMKMRINFVDILIKRADFAMMKTYAYILLRAR